MEGYKKYKSVVLNNRKRILYTKSNSKSNNPILYINHKGSMMTYKQFLKNMKYKGGTIQNIEGFTTNRNDFIHFANNSALKHNNNNNNNNNNIINKTGIVDIQIDMNSINNEPPYNVKLYIIDNNENVVLEKGYTRVTYESKENKIISFFEHLKKYA
jgi:hypothetical protein